MPRVVHFEVHADDPERAMRFYTELFGWQFQPYFPDYWGIVTGEEGTPGINGGLTRRQGPRPMLGQPVSSYACVIDVADIDESLSKSVVLGGIIVVEKHAIEGMAWVGYCVDTEGNIFGLFQEDPTAK
jgi:uncharacterized protein